MSSPRPDRHADGPQLASGRLARWQWAWLIAMLVIGFALSLILFQALRRAESQQVALDFRRDANDAVSAFQVALTHGMDTLMALEALYSSAPEVDRGAFQRFTGKHLLAEPGVVFLGWAPRIADADRAALERSVRATSPRSPELAAELGRFAIWESGPDAPVPAARRGEYFPVLYAEPAATAHTLGFDVASDPVGRDALTRARDARRLAVSGRSVIRPSAPQEFGVLAFTPVFASADAGASADDPTTDLRGFILGMFEVGMVVERAMEALEPRGVDLVIHDLSADAGESLLHHRSASGGAGTPPWTRDEALQPPGLALTETVPVGDREWLIACRPAAGYVAARTTWAPAGALAGGALLSLAVAAVFLTTFRREAEASRYARQLLATREQLLHAQKMEAVGRLAGGIAHDFNNLLQVVAGNCDLLLEQAGDSAARDAMLRETRQQAERGAQLVRRLLAFSRRESSTPAPIDLGELVRGAETLVRRLLKENIELVLELADAPLPVAGDPGQLEQVLMNLVINAADAMPEGGELRIRSGADAAGEVWLSVADTGHGIASEIEEKVFDPYFTTKSAAQGTGLGLAVVDGIVSQHEGRIEIDNRPGRGVEFRVVLPRRRQPAAPPPAAATADELVRGRGERVLVVEDQELVRKTVRTMLQALGYRVTTARSGAEARRRFATDVFDLLISDIVLPDTDGVDLANALRGERADLAVLLVSGYAEDSLRQQGADLAFLQKPFQIDDLARQAAAVLRQAR